MLSNNNKRKDIMFEGVENYNNYINKYKYNIIIYKNNRE